MDVDRIICHDAHEASARAVAELEDYRLKAIAQNLVKAVRKSVVIDWTVKEVVHLKIRFLVTRVLRRLGYPTDKQGKTTQNLLQHAELSGCAWAEEAA
ncbi:type I restriction enzyme endonuclease domain-containing protein [Desulfotignum balticum]|uniref:type I restriction enzyme endonuclease domain-containing protein n=1 Tax=Desulfotignum balticum TaxID=115781 RepID=UPI00046299F7|nr:type I restriction enzyme endonuclease domain-containing protein [Desulfotignum balticum]